MNAPAGLVWRAFDQAGLDRQYNSRGTVPDFTVYTRRYTELTRAAKARLACIENLHYGPGADQTLDLYPAAPAAGGPGTPVMVFFHGGDWRALSKDDSGFAAPAFVAAGVMFIAVNFSLVPALSIPRIGAQVRHALAWIARNVAAHGGDAARLHVAGHSSGANLVGQLLALAREEAGPGAAKLQPVDLQDIVRDAVSQVLPQAQARRIDLGLVAAEHPLPPVNGQLQGLQTLLRNLLDNALKYTPDGGQVDISLALRGREVCMVVEDSGPGLPEAERERVFDRFYRVAGSRATGSGLGLAIAKAIAASHGAALTLDRSARLGGLRVEARFPALA